MRAITGVLATGIALGIIGVVPGGPAQAKPPQARQGSQGADGQTAVLNVVFSEVERRLIREFFTQHGSYEASPLPPGIRKQVARGKPLPPGIAKRFLPGDLESRLPQRSGYTRQIVGTDVLLIAAATGLVVDILVDVIRH
jgi:hypothetical protein